MIPRNRLLAATALSALLAGPALSQTAPAPRDGTPGNPPSTAAQRAVDGATGNATAPDGTAANPAGTAASRALDRAAGTNTSGAFPNQSDGTAANPAGTAAGRATEGVTSGGSTVTPARPPASTAAPTTPSTGSVAQPSTLGAANTGAAPAAGSAVVGSRPTAAADHQRTSKIVGSSVYNDRNESVGSVDDIVLGANGTPTAVVSVGGFLGIGAKLVAMPFEQLRWDGNTSRWMIPGATRDSLTSLPTFEYGATRG